MLAFDEAAIASSFIDSKIQASRGRREGADFPPLPKTSVAPLRLAPCTARLKGVREASHVFPKLSLDLREGIGLCHGASGT